MITKKYYRPKGDYNKMKENLIEIIEVLEAQGEKMSWANPEKELFTEEVVKKLRDWCSEYGIKADETDEERLNDLSAFETYNFCLTKIVEAPTKIHRALAPCYLLPIVLEKIDKERANNEKTRYDRIKEGQVKSGNRSSHGE